MTERNYDFVVVGSGAGGLAAAVTARLAGMKTLLVEKTPLIGGSTSLSGGNLWLPNNPLMRENGIEDTREASLQYLANFIEPSSPASTLARHEAFIDAITPMISLFRGHGMKYELSPGFPDNYDHLPGGHASGRVVRAALYDVGRLGNWKDRLRPPSIRLPVHAAEGGLMLKAASSWRGRAMVARVAARSLTAFLTRRRIWGTGAALQGQMLEIALREGVDIWLDASLVSLDIQGGAVAGAHIRRGEVPLTVRATRGVLIGTAGFARNEEMRSSYMLPPTTTDWTQSSPGENGDGIAAMIEAGAALSGMEEAIWLTTWGAGAGRRPVMGELAKPHTILVDASGQRFVNEGRPSNEVGRACYHRNRHVPAIPAWLIADSEARRRYMFAFNLPGRVPKKWIELDWAKQDMTIAGLARQCGISAEGLEATVARFNRFSETGIDEDFQRGDSAYSRGLGDPRREPHPNFGSIASPPYWAAPIVPGDAGTYGGAVADGDARVLRANGDAIEGLYAAGNCSAPLAGPWYTGAGLSIAASKVFGYIAARHAAS